MNLRLPQTVCQIDRANITTSILQIINIIFVLMRFLHIAIYTYPYLWKEQEQKIERVREVLRENKEIQEGNSGILVQNLVGSRLRKSWCFSSGPKARKKKQCPSSKAVMYQKSSFTVEQGGGVVRLFILLRPSAD